MRVARAASLRVAAAAVAKSLSQRDADDENLLASIGQLTKIMKSE